MADVMTDMRLLSYWLGIARLKVVRARQHIDALEAVCDEFLLKCPYRIVVEPNQSDDKVGWPRSMVFYASENIPGVIPFVVGDAVHNLRCSLDLLMCAFARANGKSGAGVQFPIAEDADALQDTIRERKIRACGRVAIDLICSLNPHRGDGGNRTLCEIHDLDKIDKHKIIVAVAAASSFQKVTVGLRNGSTWVFGPNAVALCPENATKLMDIGVNADEKINDEVDATFSIAFGKGQPARGRPLVRTLREFADYLDRAVFETIAVVPSP